jgi:hypothetical protein
MFMDYGVVEIGDQKATRGSEGTPATDQQHSRAEQLLMLVNCIVVYRSGAET